MSKCDHVPSASALATAAEQEQVWSRTRCFHVELQQPVKVNTRRDVPELFGPHANLNHGELTCDNRTVSRGQTLILEEPCLLLKRSR